ncbi:metallothionein family protein [Pseudomonas syringae]|uniref:metallothionein family protein n=1 Tax=Pseudomonas syringae TaxID=317 RepID=UPI0009B524D3|nr:metallothionein family protein [Pseudomonas syringae]MBI6707064.1 metallothionein family protein [Pseudomonas syringae]MBI6819605.1 metallothionein family protein [Pseudomonas syringae]MBI6824600.1 metallothionein family protein [Pseudomonas syringae]UZS74117.1 metallothionein [Pseudomonas syringae]
MSSTAQYNQCACTACNCQASGDYQRDGESYCSQSCADRHPQGQPCPSDDCHCESGVTVDKRDISDSQLDEAVEETFPASDPISP